MRRTICVVLLFLVKSAWPVDSAELLARLKALRFTAAPIVTYKAGYRSQYKQLERPVDNSDQATIESVLAEAEKAMTAKAVPPNLHGEFVSEYLRALEDFSEPLRARVVRSAYEFGIANGSQAFDAKTWDRLNRGLRDTNAAKDSASLLLNLPMTLEYRTKAFQALKDGIQVPPDMMRDFTSMYLSEKSPSPQRLRDFAAKMRKRAAAGTLDEIAYIALLTELRANPKFKEVSDFLLLSQESNLIDRAELVSRILSEASGDDRTRARSNVKTALSFFERDVARDRLDEEWFDRVTRLEKPDEIRAELAKKMPQRVAQSPMPYSRSGSRWENSKTESDRFWERCDNAYSQLMTIRGALVTVGVAGLVAAGEAYVHKRTMRQKQIAAILATPVRLTEAPFFFQANKELLWESQDSSLAQNALGRLPEMTKGQMVVRSDVPLPERYMDAAQWFLNRLHDNAKQTGNGHLFEDSEGEVIVSDYADLLKYLNGNAGNAILYDPDPAKATERSELARAVAIALHRVAKGRGPMDTNWVYVRNWIKSEDRKSGGAVIQKLNKLGLAGALTYQDLNRAEAEFGRGSRGREALEAFFTDLLEEEVARMREDGSIADVKTARDVLESSFRRERK